VPRTVGPHHAKDRQSEDFLKIGSNIAQKIHCPSLFIMEGGYAVDEIGVNVVNLLTGFLDG